ncbi:MAG TPA: helix-turn-helix transcriptional regulator [Candidatus Pullichristensenella excrementigallinarum]|uniref:Helix-turn-helix transcriptional regulator n=1 Tax=Candidatus Pullichristensenella excrementigallinarum TaxID=2840907 RepID=A0A9D1ID80_9FIRM|nr:helix-turn-helix transcriptional regulator [Candidatus Pullichristensenella excrementigallinarum]
MQRGSGEISYQDIGRRIRARRRQLKLSQMKVSERIGRSLSFYGHVERGTRVLSVETFAKICCELNISATYLLFGHTDRELSNPPTSCPIDQEQIYSLHRAIDQWIANL